METLRPDADIQFSCEKPFPELVEGWPHLECQPSFDKLRVNVGGADIFT